MQAMMLGKKIKKINSFITAILPYYHTPLANTSKNIKSHHKAQSI